MFAHKNVDEQDCNECYLMCNRARKCHKMMKKYQNTKISKHVLYTRFTHKESK